MPKITANLSVFGARGLSLGRCARLYGRGEAKDVHSGGHEASTGTVGATSSEQSPTARSRHELPSLSKRSTNSESPVGASSTRSASRDEELQAGSL